MPTTTLQMSEREYESGGETKVNKQFESTVPKALVDAMGWEPGDKLEWSVESSGKLGVQKADGG